MNHPISFISEISHIIRKLGYIPDQALTIILAGGTGSRLQPLSQDLTKPVVPFRSRYQMVDFSLANGLDLTRELVDIRGFCLL